MLAFDNFEKAERYYRGLYRLCPMVQQHIHRTVILCNKDEVKRVCQLCMKNYFDDYVLFWAMTYDMSRLAEGGWHLAAADQAMAQAEQDMGTALDGFSQRLIDGALPNVVTVKNATSLHG